MSGAPSVAIQPFETGTVTHLPEGGGPPAVERAALAAPGQPVRSLPGREPLAS